MAVLLEEGGRGPTALCGRGTELVECEDAPAGPEGLEQRTQHGLSLALYTDRGKCPSATESSRYRTLRHMWEPVGPLPVAVYWRRRGVAAIAALALATLTVWGATTATSTPQESTVTTRAALSNPQLGVDGGDPIADGAAGTAGPVS